MAQLRAQIQTLQAQAHSTEQDPMMQSYMLKLQAEFLRVGLEHQQLSLSITEDPAVQAQIKHQISVATQQYLEVCQRLQQQQQQQDAKQQQLQQQQQQVGAPAAAAAAAAASNQEQQQEQQQQPQPQPLFQPPERAEAAAQQAIGPELATILAKAAANGATEEQLQ